MMAMLQTLEQIRNPSGLGYDSAGSMEWLRRVARTAVEFSPFSFTSLPNRPCLTGSIARCQEIFLLAFRGSRIAFEQDD
jgi:hypothetical protein